MKLKGLLANKYLYYFALALMALNLFGYLQHEKIHCIFIFLAVTYLANMFVSKNMTLDILAGLIVSNVIMGCDAVVPPKKAKKGHKTATVHVDVHKEGMTGGIQTARCVDYPATCHAYPLATSQQIARLNDPNLAAQA
jgi:hypothetical protein